MNVHDPYQAPQSTLSDTTWAAHRGEELADLGQRLGAALLDGIIMFVVMVPLMYFGGYFQAILSAMRAGSMPSLGLIYGWVGIGFVMFLLVQGYPLYRNGQTWGKKVLGIRIVDLEGDVPPLGQLVLMRYLVGRVLSQIPLLGNLYAIVDVCFVFRDDRRCIHDHIAGTRVVKAG